MTRSARHRGPMTPRWVRGLLSGAFLAVVSTSAHRLRPVVRLPQHLAAAPHGMVLRLADPAVAISSGLRRTSSARSATACRSSTRSRANSPRRPASTRPARKRSGTRCPSSRTARPPFYETQRNNVRILIEKIGDKIDPCKIYPAGRALPARPLPLQVHGLLRRAVLVRLPDPVQPRGSPGRGRLHRQGPPPPLRRPRGRRCTAGAHRCEPEPPPAIA